jgi:hypothetical protein
MVSNTIAIERLMNLVDHNSPSTTSSADGRASCVISEDMSADITIRDNSNTILAGMIKLLPEVGRVLQTPPLRHRIAAQTMR